MPKVDVPIGDDVNVRPHPHVGLRFKHVHKKGSASANPTPNYPPHPTGKPFASEVFEITTDAGFSEVVTVGIFFNGKGLTVGQKEKLKVYVYDPKLGSSWKELPSSVDTKNDIAYGDTGPFSLFGVH